jgi:hypothetical protein
MAGAQVSSKKQLAIQAAEAFGSLRQYVVAVTLTCTNGDAGVGPDPGKELYLNRSESASRREPEYQDAWNERWKERRRSGSDGRSWGKRASRHLAPGLSLALTGNASGTSLGRSRISIRGALAPSMRR